MGSPCLFYETDKSAHQEIGIPDQRVLKYENLLEVLEAGGCKGMLDEAISILLINLK